VDPKTSSTKRSHCAREEARTRRIALGSDGAVWAVDYGAGYLVRYDPQTRAIQEWLAPAGDTARPYAMGIDDRGRFWFARIWPQPIGWCASIRRKRSSWPTSTVPNAIRRGPPHGVRSEDAVRSGSAHDTNYLMRATIAD
jgi:streptogramin lyase